MVKLIARRETLKKPGGNKRSNMEERWKTDAQWFEENAKKNPEKYMSKDDELSVTPQEMEENLQDFINKNDQSSREKVPQNFRKSRRTNKKILAFRRREALRRIRNQSHSR